MTIKNNNIEIVKIPLDDAAKYFNKPIAFPRMPRLYLELLENKLKIKQDLINKEYNPNNSSSPQEISPSPEEIPVNDNTDFDKRLDSLLNTENDKSNSKRNPPVKTKIEDDKSVKSIKSNEEDEDEDDDITIKENIDIESESVGGDDSDGDDNISMRLKQLLNDTDDEEEDKKDSQRKVPESANKYSVSRDKYGREDKQAMKSPPTLAELQNQGAYTLKQELRDVNRVTVNEQEEEDLKRELLFKFDLLKKSYNTSSIPEFSIHSDYNSMKKTYESTVHRLSLDSSVEQYKTYLIGGFMACEFILGNFFKFDMQGFTTQQIVNMQSYEQLLIELGEKSYVPEGSRWPVEVRLLFLIIINAAFFIGSKMIMKKTGANLLGMINGLNSVNTNTTNNNKPRRKMREPNIDVESIP